MILLCRLLNNASRFAIGWVDDWYQVRKLSGRRLPHRAWKRGAYLPHVALSSNGPRAQDLFASNAKVPLLKEATFRQLSLSDYFRGLHTLTGPRPQDMRPEAIFFPIRRFDESALDLPSGGSILEKLCSLSDAVIIEDVDLNARELQRHLAARELANLAASDATDRRQMRTASLLCLCRRENAALLPGRRIW